MTAEIARSVLDDFHEQWPDAQSDLDTHTASLIDALLAEWDSGGEAHFLVEPHDGDSWTVGVRIPDRLGTLSVVSGLFTNSGLDIVRADTFTLVTEVETPLRIRRRRRRREPGPHLPTPRRRFPTVARSQREHALVVFRLPRSFFHLPLFGASHCPAPGLPHHRSQRIIWQASEIGPHNTREQERQWHR